jgi:DNA polymerase-3 subunit epsilon
VETFVAIDIETANGNKDSVCEIGLARFEDGQIVSTWSSVIRPTRSHTLDPRNFSIHGLSQEVIDTGRDLKDALPEILELLDSAILVGHNATQDLNKIFASLESAFGGKNAAPSISLDFACTLTASRNAPIDSEDFRLETLCRLFDTPHSNANRGGIAAHTAEQDAISAGRLMVALIEDSNARGIKHLLDGLGLSFGIIDGGRVLKGCTTKFANKRWANAAPNSEEFELIRLDLQNSNLVIESHPLMGKSICLTLSLRRLTEAEFAISCAMSGAVFKTAVSTKLDILVEGNDTTGKYEKGFTTKALKAKALNHNGAAIQVIEEDEFLALLGEDLLMNIDQLRSERVAQKKTPVIKEDPAHRAWLDQQNIVNEKLREKGDKLRDQFLTDPKWSRKEVKAGDRISFTQILDFELESRLEKAAFDLGVEVTKSVSKKLALLIVADDGAAESAKLRDAILKGIEVTSLSTFIESNSAFSKAAASEKSIMTRFNGFFKRP